MIQKYKNKCKEKGVSPVIGVILLVAVTVALVALATVIVFNIGSDVGDSADITLQVDETSDGVDVTVVRNENVAELRVVSPDGSSETFDASVGSNTLIQGEAGSYTIVAVLEDGSEETIRTVTINEDNAVETESETTTGTVSVNPVIEGADVIAVDNNGEIFTDTTDENGEYEFDLDKSEIDTIQLVVDGFEHEDLDHTLYASAERSDFTDNIDFSFTDESVVDVGGEDVIVSNTVSEETSTVNTIANIEQLQAMQEDLDADYKLVRDIDASDTESWNDGAGFNPIGDNDNEFNGGFDGQELVVRGLYIDREINRVGLFGSTESDSDIRNIELIDANISGDRFTGGLIGQNRGDIHNTNSVGVVNAGIESREDGSNVDSGGLIGQNIGGSISNSYADIDISSDYSQVGGLIGVNTGVIEESYSEGSVNGNESVGGLVGATTGTITDSYSLNEVTAEGNFVGGVVGISQGDEERLYSSGVISGDQAVGSIIGYNTENVNDIYYDEDVNSDDGVGINDGGNINNINTLTTSTMQGESAEDNMSELDFTATWSTVADDYPELQWQE